MHFTTVSLRWLIARLKMGHSTNGIARDLQKRRIRHKAKLEGRSLGMPAPHPICVHSRRVDPSAHPGLGWIYRFAQADAVGCRWNCPVICGCSSFYFCSQRQFSITAPACYPHTNVHGARSRCKVREGEQGAPHLFYGFSEMTHARGPGTRRSKSLLFSSCFCFRHSFSGVVLPVLIRHRSMAGHRRTAAFHLRLRRRGIILKQYQIVRPAARSSPSYAGCS